MVVKVITVKKNGILVAVCRCDVRYKKEKYGGQAGGRSMNKYKTPT
jgi:hypothetical protein